MVLTIQKAFTTEPRSCTGSPTFTLTVVGRIATSRVLFDQLQVAWSLSAKLTIRVQLKVWEYCAITLLPRSVAESKSKYKLDPRVDSVTDSKIGMFGGLVAFRILVNRVNGL